MQRDRGAPAVGGEIPGATQTQEGVAVDGRADVELGAADTSPFLGTRDDAPCPSTPFTIRSLPRTSFGRAVSGLTSGVSSIGSGDVACSSNISIHSWTSS